MGIEEDDPHARALALAPTLTAEEIAALRGRAVNPGMWWTLEDMSLARAVGSRYELTPLGAAVLVVIDAPGSS